MEAIIKRIMTDETVRQLQYELGKKSRQTQLYGLSGSQKQAVVAALYQAEPRPLLVVVSGYEALEAWRNDLNVWLPETTLLEFPLADMSTFVAAAKGRELAARRLEALTALYRGKPTIILATAEAAALPVPSPEQFRDNRLTLECGGELKREQLLEQLVAFGYERVDQVETIGHFSVRGGIIDIYPVNRKSPLRIEFFGDEIDSLREFSVESQRSKVNLENAQIMALVESARAKPGILFEHLPENGLLLLDEPTRLREELVNLLKENPELRRRAANWSNWIEATQGRSVLYLSLMLQKLPHVAPDEIIGMTARSVTSFHRQMEMLLAEIKSWQERKTAVAIFMSDGEKAAALRENLEEAGIKARYRTSAVLPEAGEVEVLVGSIEGGFELPHAHLAVVSEKDIMGRQKKKQRLRSSAERQIKYFQDIKIGDHVVHATHGIGKYVGVETLLVGDVHRDYLQIRYAGDDKLYVPTDQVQLLQKYIGSEGEAPRLSRMGGNDWNRAKTKAKKAVADMTEELLALYAARQNVSGFAFEADTSWQSEFEESFPFEETPDQLSAIAEIKADMEAARPMDRLLCGDVGFGKTEVAIRAAFKAVMNGKQVAVLVPTTVLAQQHFQTFSARFAGFGPTVDVISRFRSAKEQKATLDKLARGQIDVIIGTHRLIQSDLQFKDLGLLIVDEEQRFGVKQKERIKQWRTDIDVLTLSATPIPRTLHMSLLGTRDMSIIETPPEERFPVQSYVVEYREELIAEAIRRELKRGGQVYFVYNRVRTIDKMREKLQKLLPEAQIQTAHGQMPEEILEQVMIDFYEGRDDILLCTSIIESGLDVPNANTIIVYDADRFGLSQLYQMRGRVGRSHRLAFAYFTYRRDKVLSEVAEKRLQAIKEFAELGAGFKIAMRDLEIRGAGNLLGAQQHGNIVNVGFEMYCRLIEEAVLEAKGEVRPPAPLEPVLELNVDAYLSGEYIEDPMYKIEVYQRIAAVRKESHLSELTDELIDRFGEMPRCVENLLKVARLKNFARELGLKAVQERSDFVELAVGESPNLKPEKAIALKEAYGNRVMIYPEGIRLRSLQLKNEKLLDWLLKVLNMLR